MSTTSCPAWCTTGHGRLVGAEEEDVHVSVALLAGESRVQLCQQGAGAPYLLLDGREVTLHEAEVLVSALTQLLDGAWVTPAGGGTPPRDW